MIDGKKQCIFMGRLAGFAQSRIRQAVAARFLPRWSRRRAVYLDVRHARTLAGQDARALVRWLSIIALRALGLQRVARRLAAPRSADPAYALWIDANQPTDAVLIAQRTADLPHDAALFTIVLAPGDMPPNLLGRSVESVLRQSYPRWQLLIRSDAPNAVDLLHRHARGDQRVVVGNRTQFDGAFALMLRGGDELAPHALFTAAQAIRSRPDAVVLYSDEDTISAEGTREFPRFKPAWSPDLLLSTSYIGGMLLVRQDALTHAGGLGDVNSPAAEYDLALRVTAAAPMQSILHLPDVLYHRRTNPHPPAEAARSTLEAYLVRSHGPAFGDLRPGGRAGSFAVRYALREQPLVSIVIPSRDRAELLAACLRSLATTTYANHEILLIDNGSREPAALHLLDRARRDNAAIRIIRCDQPFNYARLNNLAVRAARGSVIVLLNNDTEVLTSDWLEELLGHVQSQRVGAVGVRLIYPDGSLQHAGITLGTDGIAGHAFRHLPSGRRGYLDFPDTTRNYAAVTAACLMLRRDAWERVGGMDERLAVAYNDVDLCLRLSAARYDIVYTPQVVVRHHESASVGRIRGRARVINPDEIAEMRRRWPLLIDDDSFFSPNLLPSEEFMIQPGRRRSTMWR
jgi:GT2 family glycosyltransferase